MKPRTFATSSVFLLLACFQSGFVEGARGGGLAQVYTSKGSSNQTATATAKNYNVVLKKLDSLKRRSATASSGKGSYGQTKDSLKAALDSHIEDMLAQFSDVVTPNSSGQSKPSIKSSNVVGDSFASYSAYLPPSALAIVQNSDDVQYIEEDYRVQTKTLQKWSPWGLSRLNSKVKNSGAYGYYDAGFTYSETGSGVTIYVLDSGVNSNHVEFNGGRVVSAISTIAEYAQNPVDDVGHGSMIAGVAAGLRVGVAKEAQIKSVKVIASDSGSVSDTVSGMQWIVNDWTSNGSKSGIVNMSVGLSSTISKVMDDAVKSAQAAGIAVVIAAGNVAIDACTTSPSSSGAGIIVGSISNTQDVISNFSNFGGCVDIFAPGENILTSTNDSNEDLVLEKGTSLSAPFVTGVLALYLEKNPKATPQDLKSYLLSTAIPVVGQLPSNTTNLALFYKLP
ncbi:hypothetical protein BB559_007300 [Furculomyces boomerangus]|uniref:Peptidase S8/S53 domain-containing protein n=2 Tax=Harpellales TaxID=61421 RepID=A0A2T9XXY1_9FUNG|nr:hypothetical protein BB559_007300 [Furculomyces boomerangus]PVZ97619.1 hypothetical protein BB558_006426 [Smittium angustum]